MIAAIRNKNLRPSAADGSELDIGILGVFSILKEHFEMKTDLGI
jgi:hypothetical protein